MNKEKKLPPSYSLLWVIVIVIGFMVIITHIVFEIGQGRWECVEYEQQYTMSCKQNIGWNENCTVTEWEDVCIKEIWTKNL